MSRSVDVFAAYTQKGWTLSLAESCTGGMVAAAVTDVAGSSNIFERGFVTYSNAAKVELLGVQEKTLQLFGAVSEEVAAEMAAGARMSSGADVAVSITGIAGPGGSESKPEGRVCFALLTPDKDVQTETVDFGPLGRAQVRQAAKDHALSLLLSAAS
jgi:nicotinamide-nucleotide amidase